MVDNNFLVIAVWGIYPSGLGFCNSICWSNGVGGCLLGLSSYGDDWAGLALCVTRQSVVVAAHYSRVLKTSTILDFNDQSDKRREEGGKEDSWGD